MTTLPGWVREVRDAARSITVHELSRFRPPADAGPRAGAVLMLFGGKSRDDGYLLLTERAHHMRSHPGHVSFPGGAIDPGESPVQAALREAEEETGVDPTGVDVFAELPELWLPPSNFAVTPVLGWWRVPAAVIVVDPNEVHAVFRAPVTELLDPEHRINVRGPAGWVSPAFLIGPDKDVLVWGFTAGIVGRLFDHLGWATDWDTGRVRDVPAYMLQGEASRLPTPNTDFPEP